jgi:hypothetical protein
VGTIVENCSWWPRLRAEGGHATADDAGETNHAGETEDDDDEGDDRGRPSACAHGTATRTTPSSWREPSHSEPSRSCTDVTPGTTSPDGS